jgi:pseudouridine-5'-phosphate glycosidase
MPQGPILIADEVRDALALGGPVVALETAVLTHGLPREPATELPPVVADHPDFAVGVPLNLSLSLAMERAVRTHGAVPATIAIVDGALRVGCTRGDLERLATDRDARKASVRDLGPLCAARACAGTTVSATLVACGLAGIRHFATGGLGGVHRGFAHTLDISADLGTLSRTPTCVVSSGAKSILDLKATLEALETLGVPVIGFGTATFPEFTDGVGTLPLHATVSGAKDAAATCRAHWSLLPNLGIVLANPCPTAHALDHGGSAAMADELAAQAIASGIDGNLVTPWLLAQVAARTNGQSLDANIALLLDNARVAALVADEAATTDA